jgi:MIP family channel proteins
MTGSKPRRAWQRYLAEAVGTFFVVFGACGAVISDSVSRGAVGLAGIAFVPGLMVIALIFALGPISAAHFNPAVTIAFAAVRRFPWRHVGPYVLAQTAGALLASGVHAVLYGQDAALKVSFGAHIPNVTYVSAFGFEVLFGFLLMLVIMAVATDKRSTGPAPALAIGVTVVLAIYMGGPISGASMNPIRSLAPALFAGGAALQALPIYLLAPLIGALLAALLFEVLRDDEAHAQSVPGDLT